MLLLALRKDGRNILFWIRHVLNTDDTSEENVGFCVLGIRWDNARAVDQEDTAHKSDILPDLCFARNRCDGAHFLLTQSVDDRGFSRVGVPYQAD